MDESRMRYFLAAGPDRAQWLEVTKAEYIAAEHAAGFRSKGGPNEVATAGFSAADGSRGTVRYDGSIPTDRDVIQLEDL